MYISKRNLENPQDVDDNDISFLYHTRRQVLECWCLLKGSRLLITIKTTPFYRAVRHKEIKMAEAMELQAMLPDGKGTSDASSVLVSSQQASESIVVQIEPDEDGKSCCMR